MLATWVESVQRTGVKNFMVIALDEQTGARTGSSLDLPSPR
jgi:hypothetical protein